MGRMPAIGCRVVQSPVPEQDCEIIRFPLSRPVLATSHSARAEASLTSKLIGGMLNRLSATESDRVTEIAGLVEQRTESGRLLFAELTVDRDSPVSFQYASLTENLTLDSQISASSITLPPDALRIRRPVVRRLADSTQEVVVGQLEVVAVGDQMKLRFTPDSWLCRNDLT